MNDPTEYGHREQYRDYPGAMRSIPFWHPGAWAMPSTTISVTSLLVIGGVFAYLQRSDAVKKMFRLEWEWTGATVPTTVFAGALVLALLIAWVGSFRPGPIAPRIWVLLLAAVNLLGLYLSTSSALLDDGPLHAASVACALGTLTLAARLIRLRPRQAALRWIAPVIALFLVAPVVAATHLIEAEAVDEQEARVDTVIEALNTATEALEAFDEISLERGEIDEAIRKFPDYDPADVRSSARSLTHRSRPAYDELDRAAQTLRTLSQGSAVGLTATFAQAWDAAQILENLAEEEDRAEEETRPEDLETAYRNLVVAIQSRFHFAEPRENGGLPRLSSYSHRGEHASFWYDKVPKKWHYQSEMAGVSVVLFDHHDVLLNYMEAARLEPLKPGVWDAEGPVAAGVGDMRDRHGELVAQADGIREKLDGHLIDGWLASAYDPDWDWETQASDLQFLKHTRIQPEMETRMGDLWGLMEVPYSRAAAAGGAESVLEGVEAGFYQNEYLPRKKPKQVWIEVDPFQVMETEKLGDLVGWRTVQASLNAASDAGVMKHRRPAVEPRMHVRMMYIEQGREGIPADATPHSIWIMPRTDPTQSMQQISSFLMTLKAAQEEIRGLDPGDFEAFDPPKGTKNMNNGFCLDVGHPDNRRLWVHQVKEKKGSSLYEAAPLDEKLYAIEISWTKAEDCKLGSSVRSMTNDQVQKD